MLSDEIKRIAAEISNSAIDIVKEIVSEMRSKGGGDWKKISDSNETEAESEARFWGSWQSDPYGDFEEDDDNEVLTDKYRKIKNDIAEKFSKKYKGFKIRITPSEKNWISIFVKNEKMASKVGSVIEQKKFPIDQMSQARDWAENKLEEGYQLWKYRDENDINLYADTNEEGEGKHVFKMLMKKEYGDDFMDAAVELISDPIKIK